MVFVRRVSGTWEHFGFCNYILRSWVLWPFLPSGHPTWYCTLDATSSGVSTSALVSKIPWKTIARQLFVESPRHLLHDLFCSSVFRDFDRFTFAVSRFTNLSLVAPKLSNYLNRFYIIDERLNCLWFHWHFLIKCELFLHINKILFHSFNYWKFSILKIFKEQVFKN